AALNLLFQFGVFDNPGGLRHLRYGCEKYQMNNGYFSTTLGRLIRLNALASRLAPYYTDESSAFD
ncbi:PapB/FocB family fimbrial expression transcriptional regulator, partial [Escherichia coli]|nr:PapB/FocB family fimbrial expression transcriptional regulator [Escherichia coli]